MDTAGTQRAAFKITELIEHEQRVITGAGGTWLLLPPFFASLRPQAIGKADLSGQWIDLVHGRRPPRGIVFDVDSSVSPTHGEQENSVWNGHYASRRISM